VIKRYEEMVRGCAYDKDRGQKLVVISELDYVKPSVTNDA
jgi:hypothetical protein